nr:ribonuclease H-like domain-containing protein [Tanacetum cinerariifolium]
IKVHRFEKKHGRKIKFNGRENARFDKELVKCFNCKKMGHFSRECRAQEGEVVYADDVIPAVVSISTGPIAAAAAVFVSTGPVVAVAADIRTKRGLGLDKYIREGELGIDDSKFSIFYTNSDELEGQPIYNRFASVKHMKAVPPPLTGNYMPPSNIPDIDESHMVYGKKATGSSEIKTNDDNQQGNLLIQIDQNQFLCRPKPVSAGRPNPISAGRPNPISADQPNPVSAGQPNTVSTGDGILGPGPLNIQSKSTYFHSFTHNNQQIFFLITHNSLYSLYLTGGLNGKTTVKPSAGWPWTKYGMSKTKGSKINGGSKSKSWSFAKGPLGRPKLEKEKDKGIVDSGCSQSMSGNKDKLEDFEDFHGGEVTFRGSTGKITGKGTIKTNNLNFENVLYVEELQHFNLISVSQICDQSHRVLFTENECLVLSKDFPLPDPSMVILSILRKHNLYTFSLIELALKGPLTCLIAKALQNESTL